MGVYLPSSRADDSSAGGVDDTPQPAAVPSHLSLAELLLLRNSSGMESMTTRNVQDIPSTERAAIEALLGRRLGAEQQVFIMAYTPNLPPDKSVRRAAEENLVRIFRSVDAHGTAQGITPQEADAALDEAMHHVRPRTD